MPNPYGRLTSAERSALPDRGVAQSDSPIGQIKEIKTRAYTWLGSLPAHQSPDMVIMEQIGSKPTVI